VYRFHLICCFLAIRFEMISLTADSEIRSISEIRYDTAGHSPAWNPHSVPGKSPYCLTIPEASFRPFELIQRMATKRSIR